MVELEELEARSFESPALSLYLTLGGDVEAPARYLDPLLRGLGEDGSDRSEKDFAEALQGEIQQAERELAEGRHGRAVALFSCRPAGLLEIFELPEEVPPMMVFGEHLETWPLREQLDRRPGEVVHRGGHGAQPG